MDQLIFLKYCGHRWAGKRSLKRHWSSLTVDALVYRIERTVFAHVEHVSEINAHKAESGEDHSAEEEQSGSHRCPAFGIGIVHEILDKSIDNIEKREQGAKGAYPYRYVKRTVGIGSDYTYGCLPFFYKGE